MKRALENTLITSGHGVTWGWKLLLLVVLGCLHVPELRLKSWKANQMILLIQPGQWRPPQLLTSDPGKGLHILLPNISQRRGWFSCFSADPAFLSGLARTEFVLLEWTQLPFKNFPSLTYLLWILQMTDWGNRLLEKHFQVVSMGSIPYQATEKTKESASCWSMCTYVVPLTPNMYAGVTVGSEKVWSESDQLPTILSGFYFFPFRIDSFPHNTEAA